MAIDYTVYTKAELEVIAGERDATIALKDTEIQDLNDTITAKDSQISTLNTTITSKDSEIATLSSTITAKDGEIAGLNSEITLKNSEITNLTQTVAQKDGEILQLNGANEQLQVSLDTTEAEVNTLTATVDQLKTPDGTISTVNEMTREDKQSLSVSLRTTKDGYKTLIALTYGH